MARAAKAEVTLMSLGGSSDGFDGGGGISGKGGSEDKGEGGSSEGGGGGGGGGGSGGGGKEGRQRQAARYSGEGRGERRSKAVCRGRWAHSQ